MVKLQFFEKDNLDPVSREALTISTPDHEKTNLQEINQENDLKYKSSSRIHQILRTVSIPIKWWLFHKGGSVGSGKFIKRNITSGEEQIIKSAFMDAREQKISSRFSVRADRTEEEEREEVSNEDTISYIKPSVENLLQLIFKIRQ